MTRTPPAAGAAIVAASARSLKKRQAASWRLGQRGSGVAARARNAVASGMPTQPATVMRAKPLRRGGTRSV
jgi:hypothetical protein